MNQAPNHSTPEGATLPAGPTWDSYYKEASRRRRASGGDRSLRDEKRRRRLRERLSIGLSALLVGAMTLVFYFVLR